MVESTSVECLSYCYYEAWTWTGTALLCDILLCWSQFFQLLADRYLLLYYQLISLFELTMYYYNILSIWYIHMILY